MPFVMFSTRAPQPNPHPGTTPFRTHKHIPSSSSPEWPVLLQPEKPLKGRTEESSPCTVGTKFVPPFHLAHCVVCPHAPLFCSSVTVLNEGVIQIVRFRARAFAKAFPFYYFHFGSHRRTLQNILLRIAQCFQHPSPLLRRHTTPHRKRTRDGWKTRQEKRSDGRKSRTTVARNRDHAFDRLFALVDYLI